jgi:hypothetical protein
MPKRGAAGALGVIVICLGLALVAAIVLAEPDEHESVVAPISTEPESPVARQPVDGDGSRAHTRARVRDADQAGSSGEGAQSEEAPATTMNETAVDATGQPAQSGQRGHNPFGTRDPERLRKIAEQMSVGETVIAAAVRAEGLLKQTHTQRVDAAVQDEAKIALADLTGYGVEGFRGVLAMLRTGYQGTWFIELVKTTYQPGYENELIAVANDDEVAEFARWGALESLQVADTPAVREFLRAYLVEHDDDEGLFMSAALALGALHDAESAHLVHDKLFRERWNGVQPYLITALGGMGGDGARKVLISFIRDERAKRVASAFRALARFDVEAARDEADRFFDSERGRVVADRERQLIEAAVSHREK